MVKEIKYGGYTATPSDYQCPDGELSLAINLVPKDGALRAVREPEEIDSLDNDDELLLIHVVNKDRTKHLIIRNGTKLYYRELNKTEKHLIKEYNTDAFNVSATGNVLCVYGIGEMEHYLFYDGKYVSYNAKDYEMSILFGLDVQEMHKSDTIDCVMHQLLGEKIGKWERISTHKADGEGTFYIPCYLEPGETYRLNPTWDKTNPDNLADNYCYKVYLKHEDGELDKDHPLFFTYGIRLQFSTASLGQEKADKAIVGIYVKEWDEDENPVQSIDIDRLVEEYEANEPRGGVEFSKIDWSSNSAPDSTGDYRDYLDDCMWDDDTYDQTRKEKGWLGYNASPEVNEQVYALPNSLMADATSQNKFIMPFFLRYGFRTITGDIICASAPMLIEPNAELGPTIKASSILTWSIPEGPSSSDLEDELGHPDCPGVFSATVEAKAYAGTLKYFVRDKKELRELLEKDVFIDSLVIAVSDPIYTYRQGATEQEISNEAYVSRNAPSDKAYAIEGIKDISSTDTDGTYIRLPFYSDYKKRLADVSVFKIIKEIRANDIVVGEDNDDVSVLDKWTNVLTEEDSGVLSGLGGNQNLMPDNVENLVTYDSNYVFSYNQREHMFGVTKSNFGGFDVDCMSGYVHQGKRKTNYDVTLKDSDTGETVVTIHGSKEESSQNRRWFYFPNPNAFSANIYGMDTNPVAYKVYTAGLTKHPTLNGAYHFGGFGEPTYKTYSEGETPDIDKPAQAGSVKMESMLYVSAQANPIIIDQRLRVGDGVIYAAAANNKPISSGQFGVAPLYAFASDGVWGIEVGTDGTYAARQAVTQDVITNPDSITHVGNAVLFITDRGIMMLSGSDTICISDEIFTEYPFDASSLGQEFIGLADIKEEIGSFRTFLKEARMVFDYIHQYITVFNPDREYAYIYSLEDKKWGMCESTLLYPVNSYPEAWAVDKFGKIVNLSGNAERLEGNASSTTAERSGLLLTRPLKLDNPDVLKTIDTMIQRGMFRKGHVKSVLFGSRDLFTWVPVWSSNDHYMRRFRGTPYKFFRVALLCNLAADESIFGCTLEYEPRYTNKLR